MESIIGSLKTSNGQAAIFYGEEVGKGIARELEKVSSESHRAATLEVEPAENPPEDTSFASVTLKMPNLG